MAERFACRLHQPEDLLLMNIEPTDEKIWSTSIFTFLFLSVLFFILVFNAFYRTRFAMDFQLQPTSVMINS